MLLQIILFGKVLHINLDLSVARLLWFVLIGSLRTYGPAHKRRGPSDMGLVDVRCRRGDTVTVNDLGAWHTEKQCEDHLPYTCHS